MKYKTTDRQTKRIEERNIAITVKMRKLDVLCVYVCSFVFSPTLEFLLLLKVRQLV